MVKKTPKFDPDDGLIVSEIGSWASEKHARGPERAAGGAAMRRLLIAVTAFALTAGSAHAYGDHEDWDCGNDLIVTGWKDQLSFNTHDEHLYAPSIAPVKDKGKTVVRRKGKAAVTVTWDLTDHPIRITANSKACHYMTGMDWYREWCRRGHDAGACERIRRQEEAESNYRTSCKENPTLAMCDDVKEHERNECRENPTLLMCKDAAAVFTLMATASHARMRHDRPCDKAQDHPDYKKLNPEGGNAIRFGLCYDPIDAPAGYGGQIDFWGTFNCGYQAYRERKRRNDNPYLNDTKKDGWSRGWETARKACTTGRRALLPFYPLSSDARMRHDRPCDIAQDKSDPEELNPDGGNANLFGLCEGIKDLRSEAADQWPGRGQWWGALNCGYYAYRQGKASRANPYYNLHLAEGWGKGWEDAHEACTAGRAPFTDTNPRLPRAFRGIWCPINGREGDGIYWRPPTKRVDIPLVNLSYDDF